MFHPVYYGVLVGLGAAIPHLDLEYVFTKRSLFSRYQLYRANVFFTSAALYLKMYIGVGFLLHMGY